MRKKLAVIGANEPLVGFYQEALRLGYEIYAFAWSEGAVCKKYAKEFYPISFTEKDKILNICKDIGIHGITSFSLESALPTVIYVAEKLNLVSNPSSSLTYTGNKYMMRKKCEDSGIKAIDYWLLENISDLDKYDFKFPIIVKPNDGGGAKGINLVRDRMGLEQAFEDAMKFSRSKSVIVETYVDGLEASAVFFSFDGKHQLITITDKITSGFPYFVELIHSQPTIFSDSLVEKINRLIIKVLDILEIKVGVTSIDLRIDSDNNPVIIEVNPRLGGNNINTDLVPISTGFNIIKEACAVACGEEPNIPITFEKNNTQIFYYTPYTAWVKDYFSENPINVVRNNITKLKKKCTNNTERSGYIIYDGKIRIDRDF